MEAFIEDSSDLEDTREDYKNELIMLHATLKKLDRDLDFSAILNPLLTATEPAITHIPKLSKQIARMQKYLKELEEKLQAGSLRQSPAQTSGGSGCSAASAKSQAHF
jgi:predicted RNase H-like nuclease (RuvC/YqgF family)